MFQMNEHIEGSALFIECVDDVLRATIEGCDPDYYFYSECSIRSQLHNHLLCSNNDYCYYKTVMGIYLWRFRVLYPEIHKRTKMSYLDVDHQPRVASQLVAKLLNLSTQIGLDPPSSETLN